VDNDLLPRHGSKKHRDREGDRSGGRAPQHVLWPVSTTLELATAGAMKRG
jgi:hypothetical protein